MSQVCATGCTRPTKDVDLLCVQCSWEVEQALKGLPALMVDLHDALTRQVRLGEQLAGGMPTKAPEQPLPFNVSASEMAADLRVYLVGWVMDIHDTYDRKSPLPSDNLAAMAKWLRRRMGVIVTHPAADDIHAEITAAYEKVKYVIDVAPDRTRFEVGPCPETSPDDGAQCDGQVWAHFPTERDRRPRMECRHCGTIWEPEQWLRAGRRIRRRMELDVYGETA